MSDNTGIEWADATWNPIIGCAKVSPGCDHCYAEGVVNRFAGTGKAWPARFDTVSVRDETMMTLPLRWRRPRRVFVNSLSDLFHKDVPDETIARVFAVMALAPQHTFQVLTKRHGRMRSLLGNDKFIRGLGGVEDYADLRASAQGRPLPDPMPWPLPNVWLGVSVEDQQHADLRVPALLDTPAAVRWISAEPLLGPVELHPYWTHGRPDWGDPEPEPPNGLLMRPLVVRPRLDWVVVGGESGNGSRPMHPDWARSLRDQCAAAGVPFLFKQWGSWRPLAGNECAQNGDEWPAGTWGAMSRNVGKKAAGRELDGQLHDGYPPAATPLDLAT